MKRKKSRSATSGKETGEALSSPAAESNNHGASAALAATVPGEGEPARPEMGSRIPAILLEGDGPSHPALGGPGEKFALGPASPRVHPDARENELPATYGTGRLLLTPRDPHCLYACWDLTDEQQRLCNSLSSHHHLLIRLYPGTANGRPINEVHVHPESRHWFIHVEHAGRTYVAELGYPRPDGQFRTVALSEPAATPPEAAAEEPAVEFKSISFEPAAPSAVEPPPNPAPEVAAPARAIGSAVSLGGTGTPAYRLREEVETPSQQSPSLRAAQLTQAQERGLAEVTGWDFVQEQSPGSVEIAALLQGAAQPTVSAPEAGPEGGPAEEISSPAGGEFLAQKSFWFNLNTELVIYGATEPDALVTIGGRAIPLRPDGSFSCRFALPDGYYQLEVSAVGPNGDARHAKLEFYRGTRYRGEVGVHPQDPALKPPPTCG